MGRIAGQIGAAAVATRGGRALLKTVCGDCGAAFATPDKTDAHHRKQHSAKVRKPSGDKPIWRVRYDRKGRVGEVLSGPHIPALSGGKTAQGGQKWACDMCGDVHAIPARSRGRIG